MEKLIKTENAHGIFSQKTLLTLKCGEKFKTNKTRKKNCKTEGLE